MSSHPEGEFELALFPLPDLVFFPNTRLPLHIFEPRYRRLVADILGSENRVGIVLLEPGWQGSYHGTPQIHEYGTIGIVEQAVVLADGRYNVILSGDVRFRIVEELASEPYRRARVVAVPQIVRSAHDAYAQREWLADLARQYMHHLPDQVPVPEIQTVGLEPLVNALAMSLNIDAERKQTLLEEDDLIARSEAVGAELAARIETLEFLGPYRRRGDPGSN